MSVLQVYLNWANSVLAETGREVEGIASIQEGQVLCQLIDILCPEACLIQKLQALGSSQLPEMYIQTALDHMRKYGIKLNFSSQDIADGDIKSMLDVLWLIILNYGIHSIRRNAHQRSVGIGKKLLLEWCQKQLGTEFDSRNTLTYNLCTGDWFITLLKKFLSIPDSVSEEKAEQLKTVLDAIEKQYSIKSNIINASDIVDGTVDEHTLMIYVSLLQRKVDGNVLVEEGSSSKSDSRRNQSGETSDWFSTSNGSGSDPQFSKLPSDSEKFLSKTISDTISDQFHQEEKLSALSGSSSFEKSLDSESSPHSRHLNGGHEPKARTKLTSDTVRSSSPLRRPRDHKTIMAEAKEKLEEQRRRREEEDQRIRDKEKKIQDIEGKKADISSSSKASNENIEEITRENMSQYSTYPPQFIPGLGKGVPIFVMPGQNPEMSFLLQALRQARHEANYHDQDSSSKTSSEETIPKINQLLDLDSIDDIPPSEYIQFENDKKTEVSTPRGVSPRRTEYVPSPEFSPTKKSIIDVVGNPPEPQTNVVDFPPVDKGEERRHFPRVEIKEDVKVRIEMERDKSPEILSPRREKSPRPLSPGYDYIEDTVAINDKETQPKTILKKSSNYGGSSRDSSYDRARERSQSPRSSLPDRSLSDSRLQTRSPREYVERDRSLSNDRLSPGRSISPKSPRSPRHRSSDLDRLSQNYESMQSRNERETAPGRSSNSTDPNNRLVKVFHQELELLRMKMEMLEKSNIPSDGDLEDLNSLTQRLGDKIKEKLSHRSLSLRSPRSPRRQRSTSPDYSRGRLSRKKDDNFTTTETRSFSENRASSSTDWRNLPGERSHSLQDLPSNLDKSLKVDEDGKLLYSPRSQGKPITLGYNSPIRNVSDEIWGMNEDELGSVTPYQKEKWKKLSSSRDISDNDIVELKHALGTVIAENDIVQAKLRNANTDITEKMKKTGEVLNDCRAHLSKANAENMEFRTQLEKERARNESLEVRMRELEKEMKSEKATNSELQSELDQTRNLLKGSSKKDIPTLQSLSEERDGLVEVLGTTQTENERLREELERAQKYAYKAQSTINDLKTIVDDARKERQQLFEEISRLQSEGHLQTITGIIKRYMDNGLYLDVEPINGYKIPSRSASPSPAKERLSRSVDSAIVQRSRSESTGRKSPRPEKEISGRKSPRSRSESVQKTFQQSRSRSKSPLSRYESVKRSYPEPGQLSFVEPVMTSSPVKSVYSRVNGVTAPVTPVVNDIISDDDDDDDEDYDFGNHYNYEDISPAVTSEFREIYPHRRTRSYRNNFSNSIDEGRMSPSLDDIEVNRILSRHPVRLDFNESTESYRGRSPRRDDTFNASYDRSKSPGRLEMADLYEMKQPVRDKNYDFYGNDRKRTFSRNESPGHHVDNRSFPQCSYRKTGEINNRLFMAALDNAVHDGTSKNYYDDHDIPEKDNWRGTNERLSSSYGPELSHSVRPGVRSNTNGVRGILKNSKNEQSYPLNHGSGSPLHRSLLARSVSPAVVPSSRNANNKSSKLANNSNNIANSKSFGNSGHCHSFPTTSSGKPLFSAPKKSSIVRNPRDLFADISISPVRTASPPKYQHTSFDSPPQLTEEEKRYADLLVEKYTKQLGIKTIYS